MASDEKEMSWEEKFTTKRLEELIKDVGNAEPGSVPWNSRTHFIDDPDSNKYHTVTIDKVENGFIVKIGCKTFVEPEWWKLQMQLEEYWTDPVAAEKKYTK